MDKERGFTLLELVTALTIMSIVVAIAMPTFTNSNKNITNKIIYSQFESVFHKISTDASVLKQETKIILGEKGYGFTTSKAAKDVMYTNQVSLSEKDIGKEIIFDEEGKVKNSVAFSFNYKGESYLFQVENGFENITINGIDINQFKKQGMISS